MALPFDVTRSSVLAVKIWSKAMIAATINKTYYSRFAGTGADMPFQVLTDLTKGPGDEIKLDLLVQMGGYGVNANAALITAAAGVTTSEQQLTFAQDAVVVEQKRLAHAWYRMSSQRSVHDMMKSAMSNLSDRWAVIIDRYAAGQLVGLAAAGVHATIPDAEGFNSLTDMALHVAAPIAHDANHIFSTNVVSTFATDMHLNPLRWKAETIVDPAPIQRINADGNETYVVFIRPEQAASLQGDPKWVAAQQNGNVRGSENPMFSGAFGFWNGLAIHVWNFLPSGTAASSTIRHAVLTGRQSLAVAFGNAFDTLDQEKYGKDFVFAFVPRTENDYGNIKGISAGCVFGMKRLRYDAGFGGGVKTLGCLVADSTDATIS